MSQSLSHDEIKSDESVKLEDTPDDSDIGYLIECDLPYLENF